MEPVTGFEPVTCCLRNSCSTPELHWPLGKEPEAIADSDFRASGFSLLGAFANLSVRRQHRSRTLALTAMNSDPNSPAPRARGIEHAGVIDTMLHNAASGEVWLVMVERRPWSGGEEQLFQLQEKLNAYVSFALDGEMAETEPALVGRPLRLILDTTHPPSAEAVDLLAAVRAQLEFQAIELEVRITGTA